MRSDADREIGREGAGREEVPSDTERLIGREGGNTLIVRRRKCKVTLRGI